MKIKKLIAENINSLYGRWTIDFEDAAFADGLFAITGPTGSGKTTVLDVICLALYAETPRIGHGENTEIVSRGENHCLAELSFEIQDRTYVASFGFGTGKQGARKGKLSSSYTHKLACAGEIIADKTTEVKNKVKEITGMDRTQFCRAALLAQGQFDAFLGAGEKKAEILERITGTAIYSRIARKINFRCGEAAKQLELAETAVAGIQLLSAGEEQRQEAERARLLATNEKRGQRKELLERYLRIFTRLDTLRAELAQNAGALRRLEQDKTQFQPDDARLARGEKAGRIQKFFQLFDEMEKLQKKDSAELEQMKSQLPGLEDALRAAQTQKNQAGKGLEAIKLDNDRRERVMRQAGALDEQIRAAGKQFDRRQEELAGKSGQREMLAGRREQVNEQLVELGRAKELVDRYLNSHSADERLPEFRAQWREQLKNFSALRQKIQFLDAELKKVRQAQQTAKQEAARQKKNLDKNQTVLQQCRASQTGKKSQLEKLLQGSSLPDLKKQRDLLTRNLLLWRKVALFEEERKKLQDGKACPLCGSTVHPYTLGNPPEKSTAEAELTTLEKRLEDGENLREALLSAENKVHDAEKKVALAQTAHSLAVKDLQQKTAACGQVEKEQEECRREEQTAETSLRNAFRESAIEWNGALELPPELDRRIKEWNDNTQKRTVFDQRNGVLAAARREIDSQLHDLTAEIADAEKQCRAEAEELTQLKWERVILFGDKNTEAETQQMRKSRNEAEKLYETAAAKYTQAATVLHRTRERIGLLTEAIEKRQPEIAEKYRLFLAACAREGMTEESFSVSRLKEEELAALSARRAELGTRAASLAARKQDLETWLAEARGKLPDDIRKEPVQQELLRLQPELLEDSKRIGVLNHSLELNEQNRQNQAEALAKVAKLRSEYGIWAYLDDLIGGSNGQKFQRVAQGITLDQLLLTANRILTRLDGRYELIRGEQEELGIDVIDHWQGDEIRTSANLSGGERFLVSLALALGLSSMAGEKIQVDSLFLDEGFGTLDPALLESALQLLSCLQRSEGKMIGVISHISAVSEALPAVIEVIPEGGGRSRLAGAGVRTNV